jgi:hypothetical protein
MWRLADKETPGYIPSSDKTAMTAEYQCMFGISNPVPGLKKGHVDVVFMDGKSIMNIVSKDCRIYWFAIKKYPKRLTGKELSSLPAADPDAYAKEFLHVSLRPRDKITFGDVLNQRISSSLVPLEEAQHKEWTWGRIACIGDSIHKCTPDAGQGGNAAIESAAAFTNRIYALVEKHKSAGTKPSLEEVDQTLKAYQAKREIRVSAILEAANAVTRLRALKTVSDRVITRYVLPFAGDFMADLFSHFVIGAEKLDCLPIPERSVGTMPFNATQGVGKAESRFKRLVLGLPFLLLLAAAIHTMDGTNVSPQVQKVIASGRITWNEGSVSTISTFFGIKAIDDLINLSTISFSQWILGIDIASSWQAFSFIVDLTGLFSIMMIESSRRANFATIFQL